MIDRNKQEVSNVSDSFVQQANGDIHNYGLAHTFMCNFAIYAILAR